MHASRIVMRKHELGEHLIVLKPAERHSPRFLLGISAVFEILVESRHWLEMSYCKRKRKRETTSPALRLFGRDVPLLPTRAADVYQRLPPSLFNHHF